MAQMTSEFGDIALRKSLILFPLVDVKLGQNLYLDHLMVVDLICMMDLHRWKLIFLACLICFYIKLLQVLRFMLMTAAYEQFLG
jgi:hypothetical protein